MPNKYRRSPLREARKSLINDPKAPTKKTIKVNGKRITIKQKQKWDKGHDDTQMREGFLALLREGFTNKDAAAACGCHSNYFKRRRKQDPDFEEAYQLAREDGNDVIRAEIQRRAVKGVLTPVFHDGRICGYKRVYSDQLLIHQSKARMPYEYTDRIHQTHTHKLEGAAEALADKMSKLLSTPNPTLPPQNNNIIDVTPQSNDD